MNFKMLSYNRFSAEVNINDNSQNDFLEFFEKNPTKK